MAAPRARHFALIVLAGLPGLVALLRVLAVDGPPRSPGLSPEVAIEIARTLAEAEPGARARARLSFPGDHWSQDDDFHNHERRLASALAARHGVDRAAVLANLDADVRSGRVPDRRSGAAPCKPRPFYE
jgi:hypothetical protein